MPVDAVKSSFARQLFMATIGAELAAVSEGHVEIAMGANAAVTQQHGFVHAGAIAAIADSACGYAALTLMPEGSEVVSVEFKLNLLAPAVGSHFVARADVVRAGRKVTVCRADVFADGGLVATMLATMMQRSTSR